MSAIHPNAIIESGAVLGPQTKIGAYSYIGGRVRLGDGVQIASHVVIDGDTHIGDECVIGSFAALGGAPQVKQNKNIGGLRVGARNMIREHVTFHCGTIGNTRIGDDNFFMSGSHVGHDCQLGNENMLTNGALVGGHTVLGNHVILAGNSAAIQNCVLGDYAFVGVSEVVRMHLIPFSMLYEGGLSGLNLRGLKRGGVSRSDISALRDAYRGLFESTHPVLLKERVAKYDSRGNAMVAQLLDFIRTYTPKLVMPRARIGDE